MLIIFYPRDIEMWRKDFDFSRRYGPITLECKTETDHKVFHDRVELIEFMKSRGVKLTHPKYPLQFTGPTEHSEFGYVYNVIQWSLLGWVKE